MGHPFTTVAIGLITMLRKIGLVVIHPVTVAVDFTEAEGYCTEKKVSDFTVPSRDENGDRKITHLFLQCGSPSI